jgi:tRNA modification GTPase
VALDQIVTSQTETIAAIATPPGSGGVGMIRVSGPAVPEITKNILGEMPEPRKAIFSTFTDPSGTPIDQGLALYFSAPASFTGEDVLELHGHGGPVVLQSLMETLLSQGVRQARPGEFSERAFLNGKIDLIQAEAVADLINSASEQAAKSALRSLSGEFSRQIDQLREKIIFLRTQIEALMDFTDEELSIPEDTLSQTLQESIEGVQQILARAKQGAVLNEGIRITIVGAPNVGKSSLLNRLLQQDRAIVTDIAGTTRDTLTEKFILQGIPFVITDTAGLRQTDDPVEQQGIYRTKKAEKAADLVLEIVEYKSEINQDSDLEKTSKGQRLLLINKIDKDPTATANVSTNQGQKQISLSVKTGTGMDLLEQELLNFAGIDSESEGIFTARQRHLKALHNTEDFLLQARPCIKRIDLFDLAAENLRLALRSLGEITGEFSTEDLLGEIFSGFCVGK